MFSLSLTLGNCTTEKPLFFLSLDCIFSSCAQTEKSGGLGVIAKLQRKNQGIVSFKPAQPVNSLKNLF